MKKILSILMAMAMLFAFAAVPSFAEGEEVSVDFTAAANIAYQKAATTIVAEGEGTALSNVTDGSLDTSDEVTGAFTLDLGANYEVNDITLYFGSEGASVNVYAGNAVDATNLIGTATSEAATVNADGKIAQYITIESAAAVTINEIYVDVQLLDGDWNIAKGKGISHTYPSINSGHYYNKDSGYTEPNYAKFVDADITTYLLGYNDGNTYDKNKATGYNLLWTLDLGDYYLIDDITMYASTSASKGVPKYTVYLGQVKVQNEYSTLTSDITQFSAATAGTVTEKANVATSTNLAGTSCAVSKLELSGKNEVARYITFVYSNRYSGYGTAEVAVQGTRVENAVNFRSHDNLLLGKSESAVFMTGSRWDSFWGGNGPVGNNLTTDGSLASGRYSGHKPFVFRYDLGDVYDVTKVDLYCKEDTIGSTSYSVYLDTTASYDLSSVSADRKKTDVKISNEWLTINGVEEVRKASMEFDSVPARYVYLHYEGTTDFFPAEIVVNGTKTVKFGESGNYYDYADGAVTAVLRLYNGTEAASQAGKVYFAAYNADDALVGFTVADAVALEAGASTEIAPAAFEVTEEPAYVKAFYWVDGTFVPVLLPTNVK